MTPDHGHRHLSARPNAWDNRLNDAKATEQLSDHGTKIVMNACHLKPAHHGDVLMWCLQDRVNSGDAMVLGWPE